MADVIRDVIIKIAIKQDEIRLKAPDLGPILLPIREVQEEVKTGIPDAFKEFEKDASKSVREVGDEVEKLTLDIGGIKPALEDISKASEESRQKLTDDSLKMGEGFRTAGEGAFTLARGLAFVGVASEEDLAKVVQTIAQVQGAFDIFKGGIDVVKGLTEGTRALRLVTAQAAVAETGLAAANTAVAVTGAAATNSMRALMLTLGPIAIAATAVGVAFLFFRDAPDDIEDTTEALEKQRQKLQTISDIKLGKIGLQLEFADLTTEERIAALRKKSIEETAKITRDAEAKIFDAQRKIGEARRVLEAVPFEGIESLFKERLLQKEIADQKLLIDKRDTDILQKKLEIERDIKAVKDKQLDPIRSAIDLSQNLFQIAKDKVAFEKGALQTRRERFEGLSPLDQLDFEKGAAAVARGEDPTLQQAELFARVDREKGSKFVSDILSERFKQNKGAQEAFKTLGFGDTRVRQAEQEFRLEPGGNRNLPGRVENLENLKELLEEKTKENNQAIDLLKQMIELLGKNKADLDAVQGQVDKLNN